MNDSCNENSIAIYFLTSRKQKEEKSFIKREARPRSFEFDARQATKKTDYLSATSLKKISPITGQEIRILHQVVVVALNKQIDYYGRVTRLRAKMM